MRWRSRFASWVIWLVCALVCAISIFDLITMLSAYGLRAGGFALLGVAILPLLPVIFIIPAALIITHQPRNTIGWLLMTPALVGALSVIFKQYLAAYQAAPPPINQLLLFVILWFTEAGWIGLIFPLLLIPLFFPTGRLISQSWRWTINLTYGLLAFFFLWSLFTVSYQSEYVSWTFNNPIGFITSDIAEYIFLPWALMLALLTSASMASIFVRYRRAALVEREQIKWLLYSCTIFALIYIPSLIYNTELLPSPYRELGDVLFLLSITTIPASVAAAILRYRLFEIDLIIRLTLVYTLVSGLLGLIYAGGVLVLQEGLGALTGQGSEIAVVITTILIAALFNPLRLRIQAWIDRRFYRSKYNAEQAIAEFAAAARNGSDLDVLAEMLEDVVRTNLQPSQLTLMLKTNPVDQGTGFQTADPVLGGEPLS